MGFKISNLFFVDEGGTSTEPNDKTEKKSEESSDKGGVQPAQAEAVTQPVQPGTLDREKVAKSREALLKAIESGNLDGYDYFEFKNSLKALESVIPDEPTRFKSAYAAVSSAMGVTSQKLVETAGHYISILKEEEKKFLFALGTMSDNDVTGSEKQLTAIDEEIKKKGEEIARLTAEIEKMKNDKIEYSKKIEESKSKIEVSKNAFYNALNEITGNITNDINKITNYLK